MVRELVCRAGTYQPQDMRERSLLHGTSARHLVSYGSDGFHWTAPKIVLSIFLFFVAGLAEIGGGWLVWQAVRGRAHVAGRHWWQDERAVMFALLGSVSLVSYGFLPTAQPPPTFGRLYAVYGGFFIVLSFAWGWLVDKDRPDKGLQLALISYSSSLLVTLDPCIASESNGNDAGDCIGGILAVGGVALAWFFPR